MKKTDLHTHSYYSDGVLSPKELVRLAKKAKIKNLALTDHNSIQGTEQAIEEGKKLKINIIPAVEIRAEEDEVLGYFIDYKSKQFRREIKKIQNNVSKRVKKIITKLNKKGVKIKFQDLIRRYRPNKNNLIEIHLVKLMKEKGYGDSTRELWKRYISRKGETYVKLKEISVIHAIKLIRKYKGVPVLAHPWVNEKSKKLVEEKNFKKLVRAGLKGIEIDNGDRDKRRTAKIIKQIKKLAKKYNLIITSGSDFHKLEKEHKLGKHNCDEKVINQLKLQTQI